MYRWEKTVPCFGITKHLPKHSTVGSPYCRDSHWSHFLPPRPSTQGHWPSNSLHWGLRLPSSSQSQASQPTPLASFQWSGAHWPQSSPITLGRHGHCPVVRLQISSASLSDPSGLQLHSAQRMSCIELSDPYMLSIKSWYIDINFKHMLSIRWHKWQKKIQWFQFHSAHSTALCNQNTCTRIRSKYEFKHTVIIQTSSWVRISIVNWWSLK